MKAVLNGQKVDRLPMIEWAEWWDKTTDRWKKQEPACPDGQIPLFKYWGLDYHHHFWLSASNGKDLVKDENDFKEILHNLYTDQNIMKFREWLLNLKVRHDKGEIVIWFTFEGFFWFPRTLFGIENHLYAFFDYPDLMHEMNKRLLEYYLKALDVIYGVLSPEFMTFGEDMSYKHGPMISKDLYDEFIAPYYKEIVPLIKRNGTKVLVDTDGFVEPMISWFEESGIEGLLPLERQSDVDVKRIRENHPDLIMIGGYDKTVIHKGEEAMQAEFERLLPTMKLGRFIPSVDHQTPPDVTIENYRTYVRLLNEYVQKL